MNKEWLIKYCITNFVIKDQQKSLFNVIPAAILWGLFFYTPKYGLQFFALYDSV